MNTSEQPAVEPRSVFPKCPTGIEGLDEVTFGGVPFARSTLILGGPGSGKTILCTQFLAQGALLYGEPGVFVSFEERPADLILNALSAGIDLARLSAENKLRIEYVEVRPDEVEQTGAYDLDGLFLRIADAVRQTGARRVVIDSLEVMMACFGEGHVLRAELKRWFTWFKEQRLTALATAERDAQMCHRMEEYVADCVIVLQHRVVQETASRRLRVLKYRGSAHGPHEYPFLIDNQGMSVFPLTTPEFDHPAALERISTGIPGLDEMMGGEGYFRGSSVLVTGTAGTGKSSIAAQFAASTCGRGERCLLFSFEESVAQLIRNQRSIGIDLAPHIESGLLQMHVVRTTVFGLESQLVSTHRLVESFKPQTVIIDPITNLLNLGTEAEVGGMMTRLIDMLKRKGITVLFTSLLQGAELPGSQMGVSSIMDVWIMVRSLESNGELNRMLSIVKARGTSHSNQMREFKLTPHGIVLVDVYLGPHGVMTGSARLAQEAREREEAADQQAELGRKRRQLDRTRAANQARMAVLQAELEGAEDEFRRAAEDFESQARLAHIERSVMAQARWSIAPEEHSHGG